MQILGVVPQLRTTSIADSIQFYTSVLGGTLEFQYEDFYAGIRIGNQSIHLKLVDEPDPSVIYVRNGGHLHLYLGTNDAPAAAAALREKGVRLVRDVHDTAWSTPEFVIEDDQGHTLYFGQAV